MKYIIDANNLAGKLKTLGEKNFDKKLIEMISNYSEGKSNSIIIVFDPKDEWGDKNIVSETITVIYTPRDAYYESADDKIVEIINRHLTIGKEELTVITDDVGLKKRVEKLMEETGVNINFISATDYAGKILRKKTAENEGIKNKISKEDEADINKELLKIWQ